jgi:hypothetical protein
MFGISLRDQRVKWLLVVALAAVLLAVILWGGDAPPAQATAARQGAAAHRSAPASGKTLGNTVKKTTTRKPRSRPNVTIQPEDELEMTLKCNPFALKPALQRQLPGNIEPDDEQARKELAEKARAHAVQQRLSEFRGKKVSVLLRNSDGGAAALIGSKLVREGDIIEGIRVLSISSDGVVVEALPER